MSDPTKREYERLLEQAMGSPEFMAQVRQAVLESPICQAKDAEIARLRDSLAKWNGLDLARAEAAEARIGVLEAALLSLVRWFDGDGKVYSPPLSERIEAARSVLAPSSVEEGPRPRCTVLGCERPAMPRSCRCRECRDLPAPSTAMGPRPVVPDLRCTCDKEQGCDLHDLEYGPVRGLALRRPAPSTKEGPCPKPNGTRCGCGQAKEGAPRPACACGCGRALVDSDPAPYAHPCAPRPAEEAP